MKTADNLDSIAYGHGIENNMVFASGSTSASRQTNNHNTPEPTDEWENELLTSLYSLAEERLSSDEPAAAEKYATCIITRCPERRTDISLLKLLARATSRRHASRPLAEDVAIQLSRTSQNLSSLTYLLAEIYLLVSDFDQAYMFCRQTMTLRRAEFGKNVPETYQALGLLVLILRRRSAEFDTEQADAFERMLPASYQHQILLAGRYTSATPLTHSPSPSLSSSSVSAPSQHSPSYNSERSSSRLEIPATLPLPVEPSPWRQSEEIPSYAAVASEIHEESSVQARRFLTTPSDSDSDEQVSPVFSAIMRKREDLIERLISKQRLINVRTTTHNRSLLHVSAREGLKLTSRKLLEKGCEPNGRDEMGFTPLHYAAANGHWVIVDLLLNDGSDAGAAGMGRAQITAADVVDPSIRVASDEGERRTSAGERRRLETLVKTHNRGRLGSSASRFDGGIAAGAAMIGYAAMTGM